MPNVFHRLYIHTSYIYIRTFPGNPSSKVPIDIPANPPAIIATITMTMLEFSSVSLRGPTPTLGVVILDTEAPTIPSTDFQGGFLCRSVPNLRSYNSGQLGIRANAPGRRVRVYDSLVSRLINTVETLSIVVPGES